MKTVLAAILMSFCIPLSGCKLELQLNQSDNRSLSDSITSIIFVKSSDALEIRVTRVSEGFLVQPSAAMVCIPEQEGPCADKRAEFTLIPSNDLSVLIDRAFSPDYEIVSIPVPTDGPDAMNQIDATPYTQDGPLASYQNSYLCSKSVADQCEDFSELIRVSWLTLEGRT